VLVSQIKKYLHHHKGKCDLCWKILRTDYYQRRKRGKEGGRREGGREGSDWKMEEREEGREGEREGWGSN
jgi:hypothetical protein